MKWARQIRREHEAIVVASLPWRDRFKLYAAVAATSPRQLVAYFHQRFLLAAPLPGDRWLDMLRDKHGVVVRCLPDSVVLEVASGQFVQEFGRDWDLNRPAATWPSYETVQRGDYYWRPV